MKEFVEKLIERLEELGWVFADYYPDGIEIHKIRKKSVAYDDVISIVNQLAEEYKQDLNKNNQGWIPCSERMPEGNERVIACFAHGTVTELVFYDGLFHGIYDYNTNVIIAWQPLPDPYKQEHKEIPVNHCIERFNKVQ